ncbi:MAG: phosphate ABC transporter permease PstA [Oscillospiraceae bacterium]|jgi:phosphate transport system permease protein|nr:phosphate ABC transporter permease PstA [Oscillospiraceae bacterium]
MTTKPKHHAFQSGLGVAGIWISAGLIVSVCLFIICYVFIEGSAALSPQFLTSEPNLSAIHTEAGGILTPMVGTVILTLISILIAFPFALATAVYLCFYAKRGIMKMPVKSAIDILSGVPTIVIGLFALSVSTLPYLSFLSTPVEGIEGVSRAYGKSFLVCGIAMAIMILPFVIKSMEEALKSVPDTYYEGALAIGASKWRAISKVVLGAAKQGLVTGVVLGMGRVVGDTAIVWLTLGGTLRMSGAQPWYLHPISTLQNTGATLTSYIYFTSPAGEGNNYVVAFGAALVLIAIILILNTAAAIVGRRKLYD